MKYLGSKRRIAKYILPIMLKDRKEGQWYVEPFCGGCNTIDKVTGNRIASDSHFELIELYRSLQKGWRPPRYVSEAEYRQSKNLLEFPYLKAYIGFNLSFGAKWFGGYARHNDGGKRCPSTEAYNNVTKQIPLLAGIDFYHGSYTAFTDYPSNSIIYCDPPYRGTTKYKDVIDYEHFYQWCRDMKSKGHIVYVSEYNMPEDFICIWSKDQKVYLGETTLNKIERLYTL
jgi:DNA adenine methylase